MFRFHLGHVSLLKLDVYTKEALIWRVGGGDEGEGMWGMVEVEGDVLLSLRFMYKVLGLQPNIKTSFFQQHLETTRLLCSSGTCKYCVVCFPSS